MRERQRGERESEGKREGERERKFDVLISFFKVLSHKSIHNQMNFGSPSKSCT